MQQNEHWKALHADAKVRVDRCYRVRLIRWDARQCRVVSLHHCVIQTYTKSHQFGAFTMDVEMYTTSLPATRAVQPVGRKILVNDIGRGHVWWWYDAWGA